VLPHSVPENVPEEKAPTTFVYRRRGARCRESEAAAGDKAVNLMGANLAQQFLRAGLLHEIQIHLMPVLLRTGVRLFDQFGTENIELETVRVVHSSGVTHLWFRVVK
jgi:dihydrofolate reductase